MADISRLVKKYIETHTSLNGRKLRPFDRFVLVEFGQWADKQEFIPPQKPKTTPQSPDKLKVALITEDAGHLTGGRYYAYFIAMALTEAGFDTTIYTNRAPVFGKAFRYYKQPNHKVICKQPRQLEIADIEADIYIGSPISGNISAIRNAERRNKPAYLMIFDPIPMMHEFKGKRAYPGWGRLENLAQKSNANILSLCKSTSPYIYDWLNKRPEQVIELYPCINSKELAKSETPSRDDYVVFISRLVAHKHFDHVLHAVKEAGVKLKVISSIDGINAQRMVNEAGLKDKVEFYMNIDDKKKFELIKGSVGMINGASFEGFGMWLAEAIACGIPAVCYDYPTFREIADYAKADNIYFAKWKDQDDLAKKLKLLLKEKKFREENKAFYFSAMVERVNDIFQPEPQIGVITIALNEEQYINASLNSVIKHPNIKRVAVVEGAVNLFSHACNKKGLSLDNTEKQVRKAIETENGHKIIYERYGWANDKSELRNRALKLLGDEVNYILVVDADEVWKPEDLDKLVSAMKANPTAGVFGLKHLHFWKQPNLVAVGSQWEAKLFRCFKFEDKSLHWKRHEMPVVNASNESIHMIAPVVVRDDIYIYHYGYMKDEKRVQEKIDYYKRRDPFLKVKDTFTNWKKGQPTQPTHGGGDVVEFTGTHPEEIQKLL